MEKRKLPFVWGSQAAVRRPVSSFITLGHAPRAKPATGVPQARLSATTSSKGSTQQGVITLTASIPHNSPRYCCVQSCNHSSDLHITAATSEYPHSQHAAVSYKLI